ncbi:MAG: type II toxin-antitoxin system RelE/ParE family toxin, partial [Pseudomonadota bacterium]
ARDGKGKRGSYRSLIIYRAGEKVFFVHGFLKSDEENISNQEAADFREMANLYLELEDDALDQLLKIDEFKEVMGYDKK